MKTFRVLPFAGALLAIAPRAAAEVHEIAPVLVRRTCNEGHRTAAEVAGHWTDHGRTSGNVTWLKFAIPALDGERIVKATVNVGPLRQLNHPWDAGVRMHYVADDTWTADTIRGDWPVTEHARNNRNAHDKGKTAAGRVSTDVTDWLALPGEGPGQPFSLRLSHTGGGLRGWYATQPTTVSVTTEKILDFGPPARTPAGPGGLAVRSALTTVFAEEPPAPEPGPVIALAAARRESESALVVVIAGATPVHVAAADVAALVADAGADRIAPANVTVDFVGYTTVRKNSWRGWKRTGLWPDVLMPMRPFTVPPGTCRLLWVTVTVPVDTAPGAYRGAVRVHYADGRVQAVPLNLRVWNVTLPETPALKTSYWTAMGHAYEGGLADAERARRLFDLFGAYRTSTDTWAGIRYTREPDGRMTVDFEATKRNIAYAVEHAGFNTINVSSGCWGSSPFGKKTPIYDRRTGEPLPQDERDALAADTDLMKLYLNEICDWLAERGWLDHAYIQLWDEPKRNTWEWGCRRAYPAARAKEPRLRLLCVAGVHPELQGLFDVWVPHLHFFDAQVYEAVRNGVRLYGRKSVPATVSASSTGGWKTGAFYTYRPVDAYDGCSYTKWVPGDEPTSDRPQWLRFDFDTARTLDGIRVLPFGNVTDTTGCTVEVSTDGERFTPVSLQSRDGEPNTWSFATAEIKAARLVYRKLPVAFSASDEQPVPEPEHWPAGVREVEFLRHGMPRESSRPRPRDQRPCEVWEYNVGADWPSVCVDAKPHEHRATGWLMWLHGVTGYLNYGGGQWRNTIIDMDAALADPPPLVWRARGNGSPNITWPAANGPLPSIRFARFRDGIDDGDYVTLLSKRAPDHPLLEELRTRGRRVTASPASLADARRRLAEALEGLPR